MAFETIEIKQKKGIQEIRIPERLKIKGGKVYLKKIGNALYIIPSDEPWQNLIDSLDLFTPDFMEKREQPDGQQRESSEKNRSALEIFLTPLEVIDFDYSATIEYGIIRSDLEKKGTPIGPLDTLIAAHAKSLDLTLITNNEKEFNRISGLKIENWIK